jgi:TRAP-type C4-dicarboxylate transport system permease small subunit
VYAYLSVPVGCSLMTLRLFVELYKIARGGGYYKESEDAG